jgi:hypothetical protein
MPEATALQAADNTSHRLFRIMIRDKIDQAFTDIFQHRGWIPISHDNLLLKDNLSYICYSRLTATVWWARLDLHQHSRRFYVRCSRIEVQAHIRNWWGKMELNQPTFRYSYLTL